MDNNRVNPNARALISSPMWTAYLRPILERMVGDHLSHVAAGAKCGHMETVTYMQGRADMARELVEMVQRHGGEECHARVVFEKKLPRELSE